MDSDHTSDSKGTVANISSAGLYFHHTVSLGLTTNQTHSGHRTLKELTQRLKGAVEAEGKDFLKIFEETSRAVAGSSVLFS